MEQESHHIKMATMAAMTEQKVQKKIKEFGKIIKYWTDLKKKKQKKNLKIERERNISIFLKNKHIKQKKK